MSLHLLLLTNSMMCYSDCARFGFKYLAGASDLMMRRLRLCMNSQDKFRLSKIWFFIATASESARKWFLVLSPVWPDWSIYWTLGNFLNLLATINLPKTFCKGVKIYHFPSEIILGNFYWHLEIFSGHTAQDANSAQEGSVELKMDPILLY